MELDLSKFNEPQKEAIKFKDGACLVLASAGSGKTSVLTNRIVNLIESYNVEPSNILAVTFTKKSADDMKDRLFELIGDKAYSVNMGTFHSICFSILKNELTEIKNKKVLPSWWQTKTLQDIICSNMYISDWTPKRLLSFISLQKNNLIWYNDVTEFKIDIPDNDKIKLKMPFEQYEEAKRKNNYIDFDDMLTLCYSLLKNNPSIKEKYQNKYKYILVDEYQDTNKAQNEIVKLLGKKYNNVFVVGDDLQSIYRFRSADVGIILNFEKEWNNTTRIILETNYRSTSDIVDWSNKLISNNREQFNKISIAKESKFKKPKVRHYEYAEDEALDIAIEIKQLLKKGYNENDFVILYRTNVQSKLIEDALSKQNILYQVIGSSNFYNRKEIKDMIAYLKLSQNINDDEAFERIFNKPNRFLGKAFLDKLKTYSYKNNCSLYKSMCNCKEVKNNWQYKNGISFLESFIKKINKSKNENPLNLLNYIRTETKYDEWLINTYDEDDIDDEILEGLASFNSMASNYKNIKSLLQYIDDMQNNIEKQGDEKLAKVKLMTIHKSKGLEFSIVFLIGMNDGILPHNKSIDNIANIEEERRLCYVGMTRAKKLLYMSWTDEYNEKSWIKSRFLDELIGEENDEYPKRRNKKNEIKK